VYCRSSTIGQQVCRGCASGFSIPKACAANKTVAIRNFNARKIGITALNASLITVSKSAEGVDDATRLVRT